MGNCARERFEHIYGEHASAVLGYLMRRTDSTSADELLAEVFSVCWRRIEHVPVEPLPWLFEVARRVLSTERRTVERRAALRERLQENVVRQAEDPPSLPESALGHALDALDAADRELLLLIAWEGLTPGQAASALGLKPSTARVRLTRARRRLARHLARPGTLPTRTRPQPMETL
jgi:RNA polymerase sigma-70 factor (ECF subfamily)